MNATISLADVRMGIRFLWKLPRFLHSPISLEQARTVLRERLERREVDFLALAKRAIYGNPRSPYLQLLALAGCEYGDLERLVNKDGVEGALGSLYRHGVFLTVDEFKGRRPAVRGGTTMTVDPECLRNPSAAAHVMTQSGASRSPGTPVPVDLASIRDRAINTHLTLEARSGRNWLHAYWGVPGVSSVLRYRCSGTRLVHWFSQVDPAGPGLHPRFRWGARVLRWGSAVVGVSVPPPRHVPSEHPLPIARWMAAVVGAGCTPHLYTYVSSAVRLCRAALEAGIDLRGAQFTVTGEPITPARLSIIRQSGADAVSDYGCAESGGFISYGCLTPEMPDEVHFFQDLHALIQAGSGGTSTSLAPLSLLISSLRPTAPFVLLNVSMGDQAVVTQRTCGCPLERLGWTTHLHTIRSFEKLTAGGMTFLDTDVIRVLEEVLPACFGGGPTDYQLVEEEGDKGQPRLRLLVHPSVGPLDAAALADAFLTAIGGASHATRVMELQWRDAGLLRVERCPPRTTASGKILHLLGNGCAADTPPPSALAS